MRPSRILTAVTAGAALLGAAVCGGDAQVPAQEPATVTVTNCGTPAEFPSPARRMFVNDGNLISMVLAIGAQDNVAAVSGVQRAADTLRRHYGAVVDQLNDVAPGYPARETVLAQNPDVMVAGWNYGYSEADGLTPDSLRAGGTAPYVRTESCRQRQGEAARGIVDPWTALREDLTNLGAITGHQQQAEQVVADIDARLRALRAAPRPATPPTILLFDSGTDAVFSSGRFGAPQAIITAGGGRNAFDDLDDTWTDDRPAA
jgi:iron complex transport system substrate-binding protein